MALGPGTRLGPYEIVGAIGAGGMGEVYRATDTRLGRTVAIKVLPEHLAADTERRQRLAREGRIVSSLEHTNICALYDIGHEAGHDFLVMQYLEGETLAERLKKGPFPTDRALACAIDIANALVAAHRLGVVHRDLKPGNVMLTKAGVKVLDFGLARLNAVVTGSNASANDAVTLPTQTDSHPITQDGMMLGTLPYMAPEQIEGKPADARTDIFALGAVTYEMLTGRRAFQGNSPARTITAILGDEPPSIIDLLPDIPPTVDRVVRKCLAKDPDARWQTARDLADELTWINQASDRFEVSTRSPQGSSLKTALIAGLALVLTVTIVMLAASKLGSTPPPPTFTRMTFQRGTISTARFSPDGRTIVYAASWDGKPSELFMTATGSPESRALGIRDMDLLDVSSGGELAMLRPSGVLAVAPLTGARAPRDIMDRVHAAEWGPDGTLAAIRAWDPQRSFTPLEFPLGRSIAEPRWKGSAQRIRVAPNGKSIAVSETPLIAQASRLSLVTETGEVRDLGTWSSITGFCYRADGQEIWVSGERDGSGPVLWAVTLSGNARVLARFPGEPVLLDIAPDGRALIASVERRLQMTAIIDGREQDLSWLSGSGVRSITDDGRTIVFEDVSDRPGAARSVWTRTIEGGPATRLGEGRPLDISPRGEWAAATITGPPSKLVLYPTGPGTPRVLAEGAYDYPAATFFNGGHKLLFVESREATRTPVPFNFKIADLGSRTVTSLAPTEGGVHVRHAVSPDGRSLLVKRQGGAFFIVPLDITTWKWESARHIPGLGEPDFIRRWTDDGVYVMLFEPRALRIDRVEIPSGKRVVWKRLVPTDLAGVSSPGSGGWFAVTRDGRTCVYSYERTLSTMFLVEGLK